MLKKENKLSTESLTENERDVIKKTQKYMGSSNVSEFDQQIIHKELIGIALTAQKNGESISDELIDDYEAMCDGLVESAGKATKKERCLVLGKYISRNLLMFSLVDLTITTYLFDTILIDFDIYRMFVYCVYPVFGLVLEKIANKHIFSSSWTDMITWISLAALILAAWFGSLYVFSFFKIHAFLLTLITGVIFTCFHIAHYKYMEKQASLFHWADEV